MIPLYSRDFKSPASKEGCLQPTLSFVRRIVPILPSFSFKVELVFSFLFFSLYCVGSRFLLASGHPFLLLVLLLPPPAASFNLCLYRINLFGRSTYLFLSNSLSRSAYP